MSAAINQDLQDRILNDAELVRLIAGTEADGLRNDGEHAVMVVLPSRPTFWLYPGYRLPSSREPVRV